MDPNKAIEMTGMDEQERKRTMFLYGLLASLLKNRPLTLLRAVGDMNGLEATRQLVASCMPASENRAMGLLQVIMQWPALKESMTSQVVRLEEAFNEYNKIIDKLGDDIKSAVLLRCITGELKVWVQLNLTDSTDYGKLRDTILRFDVATTKYSDTMAFGSTLPQQQNSESTNMEVDRTQDKGK